MTQIPKKTREAYEKAVKKLVFPLIPVQFVYPARLIGTGVVRIVGKHSKTDRIIEFRSGNDGLWFDPGLVASFIVKESKALDKAIAEALRRGYESA